jgi:mannonate dehydratase
MALPDARPAPGDRPPLDPVPPAPVLLAPAPWIDERGARVRITAVRTFLTAPHGCPHLVVRVETNDPGLYGLGCASDPQRTLAVRSAIDDYAAPLLTGRDPDDIDDLHRLLLNSAYWRGGSVTGNALGGIDVALWDLKAKRLGAPLYSLLGGRVRAHAEAYTHVEGRDAAELADKVAAARERGYRHVRVQAAVPGADTYGTSGSADPAAARERRVPWDGAAYLRHVPRVSPLAQAATLALDVSSHAFGVQEAAVFKDPVHEVYPGTVTAVDGALVPPAVPGHGVDFDEAAARRHPVPEPLAHDRWALLRNTDGSVQRP